jgi:hypothetical protein
MGNLLQQENFNFTKLYWHLENQRNKDVKISTLLSGFWPFWNTSFSFKKRPLMSRERLKSQNAPINVLKLYCQNQCSFVTFFFFFFLILFLNICFSLACSFIGVPYWFPYCFLPFWT